MATLTKKAFLLRSILANAAKKKKWLIDILSIKMPVETLTTGEFEGDISVDDKGILWTQFDDIEGPVLIEGYTPGQALFTPKEPIKLKVGDLPNVKEDVSTTIGEVLVNSVVLLYSVGDKIAYHSGNWIKDNIVHKLGNEVIERDDITAEQAHAFCNALQFITGLSPVCVPSATRKSLGTDPAILKRRNELLLKHADRLHDPAVMSAIEQELVAMDREYIKGDLSEGFYKAGKAFNVTRKKAYIMYGAETDFLDENNIQTIPKSLDEGWDMDYFPEMVNSLRDGSFSRGAATAIGGERVKFFQRIFQNAHIVDTDCGSTIGFKAHIYDFNYKDYKGRHRIVNGKTGEALTEEDLKALIGKTITLRSAIGCQTKKTDFCRICAGELLSNNPNGLNMMIANIGAAFMDMAMQKTHGKALLTETFDPDVTFH